MLILSVVCVAIIGCGFYYLSTELAVCVAIVIGGLFVLIWNGVVESRKLAAMSSEERTRYTERKQRETDEALHGKSNPAMICPHCQTKGEVHTKQIKTKAGISGGKATGAVLTGGVSLLATGLSRKEAKTEAYCANCKNAWHI